MTAVTMYEIIKNAPALPPGKGNRVKSQERVAMESLEVGDCFFVHDSDAAQRSHWAKANLKPKQFTIRKDFDARTPRWQVLRTD